MSNIETLRSDNRIGRQFITYVGPSMLTMVLIGLYGIVDGYFVGQVLGDAGLAALNLVWPLTSLVSSIGVGIGTGGAIILSVKRGEGDQAGARTAGRTAIVLLMGASVLFTLFYYFFTPKIVWALGARGVLYEMGMEYIQVIVTWASAQIIGSGLVPIIKNLGHPIYAMIIMIMGMVANVVLDWLALYRWNTGLGGIALATCMGQALVAVLALLMIIKSGLVGRGNFFSLPLGRRILAIGASPFGLTVAPGVVIVFNNWQILNYGGTDELAVYTVVCYAGYVIYSLMQGLADGVQPIISFCHGAGNHRAKKRVMAAAFALGGVMSFALTLAVVVSRRSFPVFYGVSGVVADKSVSGMIWLAVAVTFIGIARIMSAYFYAIDDSLSAALMVYADPLVFTPLYLLTLAHAFGVIGIWMTYPATQCSLGLLSLVLLRIRKRRGELSPP